MLRPAACSSWLAAFSLLLTYSFFPAALFLTTQCLTAQAVPATQSATEIEFFEAKVRPVLLNRCGGCHGEAVQMGGLQLTTAEGFHRGSEQGPIVTPGDPEKSKLIQAVRYGAEIKMPPDGKLASKEIEALAEWVGRGAPWPDVEGAAEPGSSDAGTHWAFRPVSQASPPGPQRAGWARNEVDRFILARLETDEIEPLADADRYTLLRRVYFDLTGLPPAPQDIAAFVHDDSGEALDTVVDRLLSSKHFGERWGRHWLDLTYFADTLGVGRRLPATDAWRYRDYVIEAFNNDKPFDGFLREQIAGDLLPWKNDAQRREQIVATGFLALGPWALVDADKEQLRMDVVDMQIDMVGKALLGLTLGCARCHDHKFDPVPQRDYYAMAGILGSTQAITGRINPDMIFSDVHRVELPESGPERRQREQETERHERAVSGLEWKKEELICAKDERRLRLAALRREQATGAGQPRATGRSVTEAGQPAIAEGSAAQAATPEQQEIEAEIAAVDKRIAEIDKRLWQLRFNKPRPPTAIAVADAATPGDAHLNLRGNPHALGELVPRGFVQVAMSEPAPQSWQGSGRLELARWVASERNPLTARVFVNRVWDHLFGAGLVRSVDNFGTRGDKPSHPELLDHLARRFMDEGWSVKKLVRYIVSSRAYRLASAHDGKAHAVDPENRLLWRMNRRRLDAEALRDAILQISGRLDLGRGGPSLALHVPGNLKFFKPEFIDERLQLPQSLQNRRTVYLPVLRKGQLADLDVLNLFDYPEPGQVSGRRSSTNVPTQALFLMNSPFIQEQSAALARKLIEDELYEPDRVRRAVLLTWNRPADDAEVDRALEFILEIEEDLREQKKDRFAAHHAAWARYCQTLFASSEFLVRM